MLLGVHYICAVYEYVLCSTATLATERMPSEIKHQHVAYEVCARSAYIEH